MSKKTEVLEIKKELLVKIVRMGIPVVGNLSSVYLPCGKARCKCKEGHLHGPMWRLTWKEKKQKSAILYVPKRHLEQVKKAVADYQKARVLLKEIGLENHAFLVKRLKER